MAGGMNFIAMWRYITEHGTEEQAERATEIRNRIAACWQTEAQDEADMGRLEELMDAVADDEATRQQA